MNYPVINKNSYLLQSATGWACKNWTNYMPFIYFKNILNTLQIDDIKSAFVFIGTASAILAVSLSPFMLVILFCFYFFGRHWACPSQNVSFPLVIPFFMIVVSFAKIQSARNHWHFPAILPQSPAISFWSLQLIRNADLLVQTFLMLFQIVQVVSNKFKDLKKHIFLPLKAKREAAVSS
jgi:hypothetical protein